MLYIKELSLEIYEREREREGEGEGEREREGGERGEREGGGSRPLLVFFRALHSFQGPAETLLHENCQLSIRTIKFHQPLCYYDIIQFQNI